MPLENLSGDPAQDYFAAGLSDDITTELSKLQDLFVFARNTATDYADKGANPLEIADELGVKYVLGGSVRRIGDTLRINIQLINGQTGANLWAERYDGSTNDVLTFQDGIIESILASLHLRMDPGQSDLLQAAKTDNPLAYDAFLQGYEILSRRTVESFAEAAPFLERAIELDPDYGRAYGALALLYLEIYLANLHASVGLRYTHEALVTAEDYLEKAMERPTAQAYQAASLIHRVYRRHDEVMSAANNAVRLGPNDPDSYAVLALSLITNGQPADAVLAIDKAMALNPSNPPTYLAIKGTAYHMSKDYDAALEYLERSYARNPEYSLAVVMLIATYSRLGQMDDAARVKAGHPTGLEVSFMSENFNFRNPEDWEDLEEAFIEGGLEPSRF